MTRIVKNAETVAVSVVTTLAVAVLVFLFVTGVLNPQSFAMGCLVVMGISSTIWYVLLKRGSKHADGFEITIEPRHQSSNKTKHVKVAVILLWLVASFWITRGGPWPPRLIGASVVVLFLIGTMLQKQKRT